MKGGHSRPRNIGRPGSSVNWGYWQCVYGLNTEQMFSAKACYVSSSLFVQKCGVWCAPEFLNRRVKPWFHKFQFIKRALPLPLTVTLRSTFHVKHSIYKESTVLLIKELYTKNKMQNNASDNEKKVKLVACRGVMHCMQTSSLLAGERIV